MLFKITQKISPLESIQDSLLLKQELSELIIYKKKVLK
jgi:hypothetical protein